MHDKIDPFNVLGEYHVDENTVVILPQSTRRVVQYLSRLGCLGLSR